MPPQVHRPKRTPNEKIGFTEAEWKSLRVHGQSDYEKKLGNIIYSLASLSVYDHSSACAMLFRSLLEISTRYYYERFLEGRPFIENELHTNMLLINNEYLFKNKKGKDVVKIRKQIMNKISKEEFLNTLHLYTHFSVPVDVQTILQGWNTMKLYLLACLS